MAEKAGIRRVAVTGASGFIGRALVAALAAEGVAVTALSRSPMPRGTGTNLRLIAGDLRDADSVARLLEGADTLYNLAYDVRASGADNLTAFDTLLAGARAAGTRRIVHLSSVVVYDAWPDADCVETGAMTPRAPGSYRDTKIAMEGRLAASGLSAAILQPTIVYGPGSRLWTDRLADALMMGEMVLPAPEGLCNGVHVDDLVQACRLAAAPGAPDGRFIISGPAPFAWSDLLRGYAAILGKGTVRHVPVEDLLARLGPAPEATSPIAPSLPARLSAAARSRLGHDRVDALSRWLKARLRKGGTFWPDRHLIEEFSGTGTCHIDHARTALGYAPRHDLQSGLAATADYLKTLRP
ncbi:MAG: NAD-dependent epimerase/dehydratase family protein [Defluviimonas denitrificans]